MKPMPPNPFPRLVPGNHRLTSPETPRYNCIAWAAEDASKWWWPTDIYSYWPVGVPQEESPEAFTEAFARLGYAPAVDGAFDPGKTKVAIYVGADGKVTHMARQLPSGKWTSKLGKSFDIEHELTVLDGPAYGGICRFLSKPL